MGDVAALIEQHNRFQECVLKQLATAGMDAELRFDYIWNDGFETPSFPSREVVLRLKVLHEARITNRWNQAQLEDPGQVDWGVDEVSLVTAKPEGNRWRVNLLWENEAREMSLLCEDVEVAEN
jgi:hypothetical protein